MRGMQLPIIMSHSAFAVEMAGPFTNRALVLALLVRARAKDSQCAYRSKISPSNAQIKNLGTIFLSSISERSPCFSDCSIQPLTYHEQANAGSVRTWQGLTDGRLPRPRPTTHRTGLWARCSDLCACTVAPYKRRHLIAGDHSAISAVHRGNLEIWLSCSSSKWWHRCHSTERVSADVRAMFTSFYAAGSLPL